DRKEGKYRKHLVVEYDMDKLKATYTNLTDGSVKTCDIDKVIHDPVSAMCYFMTVPVNVGDKLKMIINVSERNYELYGVIECIKELFISKIGKFNAYRVRPYALLNGEEFKKGHGYMYFDVSSRRYPLYGVIFIPFGRVTAVLESIEQI
ncbi:MAG: DUF3108 domain-containing protein, partial [Candidatus Omnitrophica bacterium]|nr:DUF3108 domain-containing protein [Candidatus Omnitrophota bacterium]